MKLNIMRRIQRLLGSTFARYVMAGGTGTVIDIAIFNILVYLAGAHYLFAVIVSNTTSFIVKFFLQKYFAFRKESLEGVKREALMYTLLFLVGLLLTSLLMYLFVDKYGVQYSLAQVITIALVSSFCFFVYRHVIFTRPIANKILIFTQKMDRRDPVLGFFHNWVREFGKRFESVTVICLEKGETDLPGVKILGLGKENNGSRLKYIFNFYYYLWQIKGSYGSVFVHMNEEYVLLGGLIWYMFGKKVYMWRNHHDGSVLTDIAVSMCDKVFCTSRYSYTAKFKRTVLMPVGIDTDLFKKNDQTKKVENSILYLGRIAPVKRPHLLIEALKDLKGEKVDFNASFYGDSLLRDRKYHDYLRKTAADCGLSEVVRFYPALPNEMVPDVYNSHEVFVNLSPSGMYDKTIFEAMACNTLVVASNRNLRDVIGNDFIFEENDREDLVAKIRQILLMNREDKIEEGRRMRTVVVEKHGLRLLMEKLREYIG